MAFTLIFILWRWFLKKKKRYSYHGYPKKKKIFISRDKIGRMAFECLLSTNASIVAFVDL